MTKKFALLFFILLLVLAGCAPAAATKPSYENAPPAGAPAYEEARYARGEMEQAPAEPNAGSGQQSIERMVIRNANLTIIVEQPGSAMTTISRMAENMGGYVVNSSLYNAFASNGREVPEANIQIRVPADQLNDALDQIRSLVKDPSSDVRSESITGQDVTREYTDLNSRLVNLEQAERQMREIMASAVKTEDVLRVHNELTQLRSEIEVIKGQMKYFREAAALSSITIRIQSLAGIQPLEIGGWQPVGVARDALQAMIDSMQFLASAAIWLVLYVLPVGLVIFLPLRLLWILIRRNSKSRPATPPAAPPASPQG